MNRRYKVLDTFTKDDPLSCQQRFTNAEGIIFLMDPTGKVWRFDIYCEKKITKIQDLNED